MKVLTDTQPRQGSGFGDELTLGGAGWGDGYDFGVGNGDSAMEEFIFGGDGNGSGFFGHKDSQWVSQALGVGETQ
jgi:hypothetical protein